MSISKTRIQLLDSVQHPVRFSYFYGHQPYISTKPNEHGVIPPPSFKSQFIIGKDHPQVQEIGEAIVEAAKLFWKDRWQAMLVASRARGKIPLLPGEVRNPGDKDCEGKLVLTGNAKGRFSIVETRGGVNVPLTAQDGRPYSGSYGCGIVNIFGYKKGGGEGISCGIEGVQFTRHGEAFGGGRVAAPTEFGLVEVGESADAAPPPAADDGIANLLGF
jgi:hypothetical protein